MKKLTLAFCCITAILFAGCSGCKEVSPVIRFGSEQVTDTTYLINPVPAAQPHNVLVEEFTGESCSNCPAGRAILDKAISSNPAGSINVISLYQNIEGECRPPDTANYDLRTDDASTIANSIIYNNIEDVNFGALPGAGIDRVPLSAGTGAWLSKTDWAGQISSRLASPDSINLSVYSTCKNGIATITVGITYTQAMSTLQNLSIAVVEDSIIDFQEVSFGAVDHFYVFNDVLVGMVTPAGTGDPILGTMAVKEAGRFAQRVYSYTIPVSHKKGLVNPSHCRVVAFVHRPQSASPDFQIYQSQQTKLMGP